MDGVALVTPKFGRTSSRVEAGSPGALTFLGDAGVVVIFEGDGSVPNLDTSDVILICQGGIPREDPEG